jgi:hypothetical protein
MKTYLKQDPINKDEFEIADGVHIKVIKSNWLNAMDVLHQAFAEKKYLTTEDIDTSVKGERNVLINGHPYKLKICSNQKVGLYQEFVGGEDKYLTFFDFNDLYEKILFDNMRMEDPNDTTKLF